MFAVLGDPHVQLYGSDPDNLIEFRTVQHLRDNVERFNKLDLDFVLITGDITHHGRMDEYNLAMSILSKLKVKYYWCLGNHDWRMSYRSPGDVISQPSQIYKMHPKQYAVRLGGYNLLVLCPYGMKMSPLEIDSELPSIALIHRSAKTDVAKFPLFDNPLLDDFLEAHNVKNVFQGHTHFPADAQHKGIYYVNVEAAGFGLGFLDKPLLYVSVGRFEPIEEARDKLLSLRVND